MSKWSIAAASGRQATVLAALGPQAAPAVEVRVVDVSGVAYAHSQPAEEAKVLGLTATHQASRTLTCEAIASLFTWAGSCTIEDEYGEAIDSDAKLRRTFEDWTAQDDVRQRDALTAHLERARTQLLARSRPDLHVRGLHALWELACRPENHSAVGEVTFDLMLEALQSGDIGVRLLACGALWAFAEVEATLDRLHNLGRFVEVLLDLICGPDPLSAR